jgi:Mrp family chromosome partitioning ATPase
MRVSDERNLFICDLPPVFANDDAVTVMGRLDGYILVAEEGKTKQREISDAVSLLGEGRLAGVILNKYRGGVISEGYGVDDYYAFGYGQTEPTAK